MLLGGWGMGKISLFIKEIHFRGVKLEVGLVRNMQTLELVTDWMLGAYLEKFWNGVAFGVYLLTWLFYIEVEWGLDDEVAGQGD